MDVDVPAAPVVERLPVSGRAALFRAATGVGISVALVAFVALVWHDVVEGALGCILLGSVGWLYEPNDRHSKVALLVSGGLSLVIGIAAAVLLRDGRADLSRDVACAALGALAGSQIYAAITRHHS